MAEGGDDPMAALADAAASELAEAEADAAAVANSGACCAAPCDPFGLFEYKGNGRYEKFSGGQVEQPVVLYVHGWQPGANVSPAPDSFETPAKVYGEQRDVAIPWLAAGFRIFCFLWRLFADERDVATAEQKIWSAGLDGAQRRRRPGAGAAPGAAAGTAGAGGQELVQGVGDIGGALFKAYRRDLSSAPRVHLVGHSLGCQMVGRMLELLLDARGSTVDAAAGTASGSDGASAEAAPPLPPLPQRVTLLDPYFTNFPKPYLKGRWTGEAVREAVRRAAEQGVIVEQVASSAVLENPLSDSNTGLRFHTAYYVLNADFIKLRRSPKDAVVLYHRHLHARFAYFASLPEDAGGDDGKGADEAAVPAAGEVVSGLAGQRDAEVRRMMGSDWHFVQVEGTDRWEPRGVRFERRPGSGCSCGAGARPKAPVQYL